MNKHDKMYNDTLNILDDFYKIKNFKKEYINEHAPAWKELDFSEDNDTAIPYEAGFIKGMEYAINQLENLTAKQYGNE